jgi:hypothetical protein
MCDGRWARQHRPATNGVIESTPQHDVELEDALVVEPARSIGAAVVSKLSVATFEVIDAQMSHRHAADGRNDVRGG